MTLIHNLLDTAAPVNSTVSCMKIIKGFVNSGDVTSIIIFLVVFFVMLVLINKISDVLLKVLKRVIILLIVILVIYDFFPSYFTLLRTDGITFSNVLLGIFGFGIYLVVFFFAIQALIGTTKKEEPFPSFESIVSTEANNDVSKTVDLDKISPSPHPIELGTDVNNKISSYASRSDKRVHSHKKSLSTILVYLVAAEFAAYTNPTFPAPNPRVGAIILVIILGSLFIYSLHAFRDRRTGIQYYFITLLVGILFTFTLDMIWNNVGLAILLSPGFFGTESFVALISGMGVAMIAGSQ